ncbi:RHS repeat-associated core domain-containing protein [Pseudomonas mosselii]|uniref:RHS repeat-associated core domain-containing protein n=1 Tax=unclassified Pseudomonas TaxID=196821 RepID=UPI0020C55ECA|nr:MULTISPECIES: RHS repeat-associated core domain-containing protein [unclassified Pseudomonas]MCP8633626.1 RHS repeat-associated core domain-containing protein [Pseudomonas sp. DVZ6]MDD7785012.1 RHS repeat-associated core domain-containing protein [Pseudomonas sp. DVZ24]
MPDSTITSNTALLATDRHGSVLRQHAVQASLPIPYTAFGFRPVANELPSVLGFNGQMQELNIRDYLLGNGYRVYSPMLMRFLSPDSLSPFGEGGPNAYVYCSGDPVNAVDPSGHTLTYKIKIKIDRPSGPVPGGEYVPSLQKVSNRTGDTVNLVHEAQSYEATSDVVKLYVFESNQGEPILVNDFHVNEMQGIADRKEAISREGTGGKDVLKTLDKRAKEIAKMGASMYLKALDPEIGNVNFVQDSTPLVRES